MKIPERIVEVCWMDAGLTFEGEDLNHRTVGYLIHDGEKSVAVCSCANGTRDIDAAMVIPRVAVISIRDLVAEVRCD